MRYSNCKSVLYAYNNIFHPIQKTPDMYGSLNRLNIKRNSLSNNNNSTKIDSSNNFNSLKISPGKPNKIIISSIFTEKEVVNKKPLPFQQRKPSPTTTTGKPSSPISMTSMKKSSLEERFYNSINSNNGSIDGNNSNLSSLSLQDDSRSEDSNDTADGEEHAAAADCTVDSGVELDSSDDRGESELDAGEVNEQEEYGDEGKAKDLVRSEEGDNESDTNAVAVVGPRPLEELQQEEEDNDLEFLKNNPL